MENIKGEKPFQCKICGKSFSNLMKAKEHIDHYHIELYQFQCRICQEMFIRLHSARNHFYRHHFKESIPEDLLHFPSEEAYKYVCQQQPGTKEENSDTSIEDVLDQEALADLECEYCFIQFSDILSLTKHQELSHPEIPVSLLNPSINGIKTESDVANNSNFEIASLDCDLDEQNDTVNVKSLDEYSLNRDFTISNQNLDVSNNIVIKDTNAGELDSDWHCQEDSYCDLANGESDEDEKDNARTQSDFITITEPNKDKVTQYGATNVETKLLMLDSVQGRTKKKKTPSRCTICQLIFSYYSVARKHVDYYHLKIRQYLCCYCHQEFLKRHSVAVHCKKTHKKPLKFVHMGKTGSEVHIEVLERRESESMRTCDVCGAMFKLKQQLTQHKRTKHEANQAEKRLLFACSFCPKKFTAQIFAKNHVEERHLYFYKFICAICNKTFRLKKSVFNHCKVQHNDKRKIKIKRSDFALQHITDIGWITREATTTDTTSASENTKDMKTDEILTPTRTTYTCDKCGFETNSKERLYVHSNKKIKCDQIQVKDENTSSQAQDEKINACYIPLDESDPRYTELHTHRCLHCNYLGTSEKKTKQHVSSVHLKLTPFECDQCEAKLASKQSLRHHVKLRHSKGDSNLFICELCGKSFNSTYGLTKHRETHSTDLNFQCDVCNKAFKSRLKLSLHRKHVHTGDHQVQCDICGVYVKTQMYLRKHRNLVHCKERKFECTICHAKFPLGSTLRLHIKGKHEQVKEECEHCHKMYSAGATLKQHIEAVHLKLKPHECTVCHRTFGARVAMVSHMKKVHNVNPQTRSNNKFKPPTPDHYKLEEK